MYLTHSFVVISKGELDYLFFYITEVYVYINNGEFIQ